MTVPLRDEERERLDGIKSQLDEERKNFTEAAVRLGKERAGLEVRASHFAIYTRLTFSWLYDRPNELNSWMRRGLGKCS